MSFANILIGTPCYGGQVTSTYMESVLQMIAYGSQKNIMFTLGLLAHDSLIPRARNKLMAKFLDSPALTHLFFIDADHGFQPEIVSRMVDLDEELVAGVCPLKVIHWPQVDEAVATGKTEHLDAAGLNYVGIPCEGEDREEKNGFVTGNYAGTGFMLIKKSAAQKMVEAYPETKFKAAQTYPIEKNPSDNNYNLFDCIVDPDTGTYLSEDFTFCKRWRKLGGKIWLDQESKISHVGNYTFLGDPKNQVG